MRGVLDDVRARFRHHTGKCNGNDLGQGGKVSLDGRIDIDPGGAYLGDLLLDHLFRRRIDDGEAVGDRPGSRQFDLVRDPQDFEHVPQMGCGRAPRAGYEVEILR